MGMFDTMNQGVKPGLSGGNSVQSAVPNAMGQGFAQQNPQVQQNAWQQKQQMKANPMMKRPAMGASFGQPNMSQQPNAMTGARPAMASLGALAGQAGSRSMMQDKAQQLKTQQAAAQGGGISGSYGELASKYPKLQENRQYGEKIGQDMSWMDKPGALLMGPQAPTQDRPQYGLQDVASRMEQERNPNPEPQMSPMQQAAEQMRGYEGPDLGSQDPREILRMKMMNSGGGGAQPDVMSRGGIGPSNPMEQMGYAGAEQMNPGAPSPAPAEAGMAGGGGGYNDRFAAMNKPMRLNR